MSPATEPKTIDEATRRDSKRAWRKWVIGGNVISEASAHPWLVEALSNVSQCDVPSNASN